MNVRQCHVIQDCLQLLAVTKGTVPPGAKLALHGLMRLCLDGGDEEVADKCVVGLVLESARLTTRHRDPLDVRTWFREKTLWRDVVVGRAFHLAAVDAEAFHGMAKDRIRTKREPQPMGSHAPTKPGPIQPLAMASAQGGTAAGSGRALGSNVSKQFNLLQSRHPDESPVGAVPLDLTCHSDSLSNILITEQE
jgi:hypothetical protein